ncbi:carbohydrate ABC transporter permease [Paenibacillus psychroresistens]|uniref:Carbohydrate ABC transporter permease n=1 Tax=Paenibacillus psychroresistens TaxID=1778678 RepID=A0A6B8RIL2_9BACL|nr:carbohydrate ABC transporter permease [Paenibacillus psychroresistens]QGQ95574.1 carbohydrate ABC transporter permease [Paenibacillus psychroresistens]
MKENQALNTVKNVFLGVCTLFFIWPFYWMLSGSFKKLKVAMQIPPEWFPLQPTFRNYSSLMVDYPTLKWLFNSIFISSVCTILVLLLSSLSAYSIAKIRFSGSKLIFAMMVGAMTIPHTVLFIPLFKLMNQLHLVNTLWGALLPMVGWPFGVFLLKQFIQTLPNELLESGKIDGCNEWQLFSRIIIPLAKPGLAVLAIFTFVNSWNDYVWQLIILSKKSVYSLPLGVKVASQVSEFGIDYGIALAGAMVATVPILAIFLYFQKYFTKGITLGALKG